MSAYILVEIDLAGFKLFLGVESGMGRFNN